MLSAPPASPPPLRLRPRRLDLHGRALAAIFGLTEHTLKGGRMKLNPGDQAPGFHLQDQHGNSVLLEDFAGRRLAVFFYPKASTPG